MTPIRANLGGEGEVAGVLNQLGLWVVVDPAWRASRLPNPSFEQLVNAGHSFLIADNINLPLPDDCCDEVITNYVPVDQQALHGPGVQSSEIRRILKSGDHWVRDGTLYFVKP